MPPTARRVAKKKWLLFVRAYQAMLDLGMPKTERDVIVPLLGIAMGGLDEAAMVLDQTAPEPRRDWEIRIGPTDDETQHTRDEMAARVDTLCAFWSALLRLGMPPEERRTCLALAQRRVGIVLDDLAELPPRVVAAP